MSAQLATLSGVNSRIDARSIPFANKLAAWLTKLGRIEMQRAIRDPHAYAGGGTFSTVVQKADPIDPAELELQELVRLFGMRAAVDAANRTAGAVIVPSALFSSAVQAKPVKIKWFWELENGVAERSNALIESTRNLARESVRKIIEDSLKELPRPSPAEIARRIRTAFTGPGDIEREHRVHAVGPSGREFIFSSQRAAIIARTELAQAENTGIMAGYEATGIEDIEWLGYGYRKASGKRAHYKMRHVRIRIGELFTLPSGAKLRYPGDPAGPISETINCQCTTRGVVARR